MRTFTAVAWRPRLELLRVRRLALLRHRLRRRRLGP